MSSKHRHGLPRKRPGRTKKEAIAAELPVLESADKVPTLQPADDGPVSITCEACEDEGIDTLVTIDVSEMEKKAVPGAVEGPLQGAVKQHAGAMRWQCVVVRFTGDALIGSAMKGLVAESLQVAKPRKVIVRRGYGDEVVHEVEAPKLDVATAADGDVTTVTIATGELETCDLPQMFAPVLADLVAKASGTKLTLTFSGAAKPDSAMREQIGQALQDAGAVRATVGARVLFDRELTDRCLVTEAGDEIVVTIDPAADPAITGEAMETVLPDHALGFAGKAVRVNWKTSVDHGEGDHFVRIVANFVPEHIEFVRKGGEPEVVWPAVLELVTGSEVTLRVCPNGRSHTAVLAEFPRECADLEGELRGKPVIVDWPKLFMIDDDTERCLVDSMADIGPKSVCCTVAGENREPFLPPPVLLSDEEDHCTISVDTDAGRPIELVRAVERTVPRFVDRVAGKAARVVISGAAPASRTLLRAVLDRVVDAGPERLELEDHGPIDVLLPPMLTIARSGETEVRIEVDPRGRDEDQQGVALKRELDDALPKKAVVTIVTSPLDARLLEDLISHAVESVTSSDGTQLYPEPLPEPEPAPETDPTANSPEPTTPTPPANTIRVLAQNNDAIPPTVLLAVDAGTDPAHLAVIEAQLTPNLERFNRRAVMIVLQQDGQDVPVRRSDEMVNMLGRVLSTSAAAALVFRGPDAKGRPHFQVLQSSLRAMPVGATFGDPRMSS